MSKKITCAIAVLFCISTVENASAAVSADEAKQLAGSTLTEWGAEKAGNKDGSIPEYTGKKPTISSEYEPKYPGNYFDPYNEKPLYSITSQNAAQYADKLTEGQKLLFKKYPDYRMDIYPTHRSHVYPKYVLENTIKNATVCKTTDGGVVMENCWGGVPFPIPKTGNEVMWNHALPFVASDYDQNSKTWVVSGSTGERILQSDVNVWQSTPYFDPKQSKPWTSALFYNLLRYDISAPARKVGEKIVIQDSLHPLKPGRRAWSYIPGQRRVKLAPDLAYDTPSPVAGGASTMDDVYVFYGAQDRFDFKLVEKKETFIPYNNFWISDYKKCPESVLLKKNFINPDCMRWELHRTWVIEATLKPGFRHIYKRRTMYFDEDNLGVGTGDNYDASGNIYRITNVLTWPLADPNAGSASGNMVTMDLQTGNYTLLGGMTNKGYGTWPVKTHDHFLFSPEAMASEGVR